MQRRAHSDLPASAGYLHGGRSYVSPFRKYSCVVASLSPPLNVTLSASFSQFSVIRSKVSSNVSWGNLYPKCGFLMKHKNARGHSSKPSHAMQRCAAARPHLHLLCICHLRGRNMQTAPTPVNVFKKKKIALPTAQLIFLILGAKSVFLK